MKPIKSKEPKVISLILTAFSGIFLGALLGAYLLIIRPVVPMSTEPTEEQLSKVGNYDTYYSKGRMNGMETANLRSGLRRIESRSPGPISFSEEEVNYFFAQYKSDVKPAEGDETTEPPASELEQFNLRIRGDQMVVSFKIISDPKGDNRFVMQVQADLNFKNTDVGPELHVSNVRVNSLPIPSLGGLLSSIVSSRISGMPMPEELTEMWENIRRIELESDKLILDVGLRKKV